jgi:FkbM family methyltransferase
MGASGWTNCDSSSTESPTIDVFNFGHPMNFLERVIRRVFLPGSQMGYSQFGEDLIVSYLFNTLGIQQPTYLDVGANHPKFISNTYYFYKRGAHGVLVEPNPRLAKLLRSARPRDIVLEVGIGLTAETQADFYVFGGFADGLSTFSKSEATHWETVGLKGHGTIPVEKVIKVPLVPINKIVADNFQDKAPSLLSLDVEGLDLDVLKGLDFDRFAPDVVCVETLGYHPDQSTYKKNDIIDFMLAKNYVAYADTRVNTIFCRAALIGH